jgi:hypothetical protein
MQDPTSNAAQRLKSAPALKITLAFGVQPSAFSRVKSRADFRFNFFWRVWRIRKNGIWTVQTAAGLALIHPII